MNILIESLVLAVACLVVIGSVIGSVIGIQRIDDWLWEISGKPYACGNDRMNDRRQTTKKQFVFRGVWFFILVWLLALCLLALRYTD